MSYLASEPHIMLRDVLESNVEINIINIMDPVEDYSTVDVYDVAADIGKEFERIIDVYGSECIMSVMPKIVSVLEHLEHLAQRNERENAELSDLRIAVTRLECDKAEKMEERAKFERDIEAVESDWHRESEDLLATIQKLQEENRRLEADLHHLGGSSGGRHRSSIAKAALPLAQGGAAAKGFTEEDLALMTKLKEVVDKQRDELRQRDKTLAEKTAETEAMSLQVERLTRVNADLRRRNKLIQNQSKGLIEEKVDIQTAHQETQHELARLRDRCSALERKAGDLEECEQHREKQAADRDKDPNRPRFTMAELRDVLLERNELKVKVLELQEELEIYRPKSSAISTPTDDDDEEEAPVQGPMLPEPDDAPWKKAERNQGVKRFFRFFFGESSSPFEKSPGSSSGQASPATSTSASPKRSPRRSLTVSLPAR